MYPQRLGQEPKLSLKQLSSPLIKVTEIYDTKNNSVQDHTAFLKKTAIVHVSKLQII